MERTFGKRSRGSKSVVEAVRWKASRAGASDVVATTPECGERRSRASIVGGFNNGGLLSAGAITLGIWAVGSSTLQTQCSLVCPSADVAVLPAAVIMRLRVAWSGCAGGGCDGILHFEVGEAESNFRPIATLRSRFRCM